MSAHNAMNPALLSLCARSETWKNAPARVDDWTVYTDSTALLALHGLGDVVDKAPAGALQPLRDILAFSPRRPRRVDGGRLEGALSWEPACSRCEGRGWRPCPGCRGGRQHEARCACPEEDRLGEGERCAACDGRGAWPETPDEIISISGVPLNRGKLCRFLAPMRPLGLVRLAARRWDHGPALYVFGSGWIVCVMAMRDPGRTAREVAL